jgi:hypothetical protein
MGHAAKDRECGLIYAMRVSEVVGFDDYYKDPRFQVKKPRFGGNPRDACGDNIYYMGDDRAWKQRPTRYHGTPQNFKQDTDHPRVFVSNRFYYFGENAPQIPDKFRVLIRDRQGVKWRHPADKVDAFVEWVQATFEPGIHGDPRDLDHGERKPSASRLYPLGRKPRQKPHPPR